MTEAEREELVEKIAKATWPSDAAVKWEACPIFLKQRNLDNARAALAVAEPVIREQCARIADKTPYAFNVAKDMNTIAAAIREGGKGNENNA